MSLFSRVTKLFSKKHSTPATRHEGREETHPNNSASLATKHEEKDGAPPNNDVSDAIYKYLCYRYKKALNGNSYPIHRYKSYNVAEIIKIDTLCCLSALRDMTETRSTAEDILKRALYRLFSDHLSIDLIENDIHSPDDIDISFQLEWAVIFDEEDWLFTLSNYLIVYIYNTDISSLEDDTKNEIFNGEVLAQNAIELSTIITTIKTIVEGVTKDCLDNIEELMQLEDSYLEAEPLEISEPSKYAEFMLGIIHRRTLEDDLKLAPSEEQSKRLGVPESDRKLAANEFTLLRAVGVSLFIRAAFDEKYYLEFNQYMLPLVIERLRRNASHKITNHEQTFNSYLDLAADSDSHILDFSDVYMRRAFPSSNLDSNIDFIAAASEVAVRIMHGTSDATKAAYCSLKYGLSPSAFEQLENNNP